ncbi:N-terminal acetyltransferase [Aspergillus tubingensis]|uniref:Arylamine N-acetyltransferase 1 n=1 Tax=Aspergillus niger TaxID=5061 RepID=A0A117DY05_ASPNG|nr:arylamine N-acetyltransferase 1 [Aspergillus tubingensis]GAQ36142.1 arylamine N-acetyltransferase 1 [Aspergillus niger]GFN14340.1 arylamine N-acetyltransferase 1 [Aspergillus tubingensis]GLA63906.1 N-terminal acetyltransferase [Aspergillus tubingensis]GLB12998.1 N-terminal acetyltransferase [Aspergillus tubingensis]
MSELSASFTIHHLDGYFERIELPARFRREQNPKLDRGLLATIQAYHVSHIPYDNTALHYSPTPSISLHIHDIFHKLVTRKRGGYCMENNILLYHVLRQLGFDVYLTGARLFRDANNPKPGWSGWEHAVNIVTLADNSNYMLDVGYGGDGPTTPLPLVHTPIPIHNIGTQEICLQKNGESSGDRSHSANDPSTNAWTYQFRNGSEQAWRVGYAFHELEFFPRDFEVMNFYTSQNPTSFLTQRLLVIRFLQRADGEVYGKVILDQDKLKENRGGKNELVKVCNTESERVDVLRDVFGVDLTEEERRGVCGRVSALPV